MTLRIFSLLSVLFFAGTASAIDVTQCPQNFDMTVKVVRVFKSSKYSKVPGWKEAQAALSATDEINASFKVTEVDASTCKYEDSTGQSATLSTASFQDPEERKPSLVDQLVVKLKIDGSSFVSFLPVKAYSPAGLEAYDQPFELKVKSRLYFVDTKRWVSFDMGMISISLN